jgi:hypothetical protein
MVEAEMGKEPLGLPRVVQTDLVAVVAVPTQIKVKIMDWAVTAELA